MVCISRTCFPDFFLCQILKVALDKRVNFDISNNVPHLKFKRRLMGSFVKKRVVIMSHSRQGQIDLSVESWKCFLTNIFPGVFHTVEMEYENLVCGFLLG